MAVNYQQFLQATENRPVDIAGAWGSALNARQEGENRAALLNMRQQEFDIANQANQMKLAELQRATARDESRRTGIASMPSTEANPAAVNYGRLRDIAQSGPPEMVQSADPETPQTAEMPGQNFADVYGQSPEATSLCLPLAFIPCMISSGE